MIELIVYFIWLLISIEPGIIGIKYYINYFWIIMKGFLLYDN